MATHTCRSLPVSPHFPPSRLSCKWVHRPEQSGRGYKRAEAKVSKLAGKEATQRHKWERDDLAASWIAASETQGVKENHDHDLCYLLECVTRRNGWLNSDWTLLRLGAMLDSTSHVPTEAHQSHRALRAVLAYAGGASSKCTETVPLRCKQLAPEM